ncbi:MAG TPA: hypothetical protein VJ829_00980 [Candidatus Binatia bacterium]|nr:hypothetical protein [Candidatus Binatia bacterium]
MPSILRDVVQVAVASLVVLVCLRLAGIDVLPLLTTSAVLTAVIDLALHAATSSTITAAGRRCTSRCASAAWWSSGTGTGCSAA